MLCIPAKVTHPDNEKGKALAIKNFSCLKNLSPSNQSTDLVDILKIKK